MLMLVIIGRSQRLQREVYEEPLRRLKHQGWRTETIDLLDFLAAPPNLSRFDDVGVIGGDGAINACLAHTGTLPLLVLPLGTGNDLARTLGIRTVTDSLAALMGAKRVTIDIGEARSGERCEYFVNNLGFGLDGLIAAQHARGVPYELAALGHGLRPPGFTARLSVDGLPPAEHEFLSLGIANGAYSGGGFRTAPRALLDDGLLDLLLIGRVSPWRYFTALRKVKHGRHIGEREVSFSRCRSVLIESDVELPWHVDGECRTARSVEIRVLPKARTFYHNR